jgi:hypothetical protein
MENLKYSNRIQVKFRLGNLPIRNGTRYNGTRLSTNQIHGLVMFSCSGNCTWYFVTAIAETCSWSPNKVKFPDTKFDSLRSVLILSSYPGLNRSRYSDWLRAGRPRGRRSSLGGVKNFHFSVSSRPALGPTQPPIQWTPGALSLGVKRPGCEADHLPPTSAEDKKMWIYTSSHPYVFKV